MYDGVRAAHYVFKPPFAFHDLSPKLQQQAEWIMEHHHAIEWKDGQVPAYLFKPILNQEYQMVDYRENCLCFGIRIAVLISAGQISPLSFSLVAN